MRLYRFTLILTADPTLDQLNHLYTDFGDSLLSGVQEGTAFLDCALEGPSFEEAIRQIMAPLKALGLSVERIEVDRDGLSTLDAA